MPVGCGAGPGRSSCRRDTLRPAHTAEHDVVFAPTGVDGPGPHRPALPAGAGTGVLRHAARAAHFFAHDPPAHFGADGALACNPAGHRRRAHRPRRAAATRPVGRFAWLAARRFQRRLAGLPARLRRTPTQRAGGGVPTRGVRAGGRSAVAAGVHRGRVRAVANHRLGKTGPREQRLDHRLLRAGAARLAHPHLALCGARLGAARRPRAARAGRRWCQRRPGGLGGRAAARAALLEPGADPVRPRLTGRAGSSHRGLARQRGGRPVPAGTRLRPRASAQRPDLATELRRHQRLALQIGRSLAARHRAGERHDHHVHHPRLGADAPS